MKSLERSEDDAPGPAAPGRLALELRRKTFHLLCLLYLGGYRLLERETAVRAMVAVTVLTWGIETWRLRSALGRRVVEGVFGPLIRSKEGARYTGAFYTSLGAMGVIALFGSRPEVVTAALLYLALGDAASAVVGVRWGRHPYWILGRKRSLEGSAAGMTVALAAGLAAGLTAPQACAGALAFAVADAVPIPPDDNVWIPVLPGAVLFTLRQMW